MAKTINKSEEIMNKLKKTGGVIKFNNDDNLKAMEAMNKSTEKTKEEFQIKDMNSQVATANLILK
jgi:butyrate kinase